MFQPSEIQGVVEVFELLEIKSEFWGGKPSTEVSAEQPEETTNKEAEEKTSWTSKPSGQEETVVEENVEANRPSVKECTSVSVSYSESTSRVCDAPSAVKREVEVDMDICSEEEPVSDKTRRRSSSSLLPVNLSLSNPDNKEHSNLNSPVSDRDSRVGRILSYYYQLQVSTQRIKPSVADLVLKGGGEDPPAWLVVREGFHGLHLKICDKKRLNRCSGKLENFNIAILC